MDYKKFIKRIQKKKLEKAKKAVKKEKTLIEKAKKKAIEKIERKKKIWTTIPKEKAYVLVYYVSGVKETQDKKKRRFSEITLTARIKHFVKAKEKDLSIIIDMDITKISIAVRNALYDVIGRVIDFRVDFIEEKELEGITKEYYAVSASLVWSKWNNTYDYSEEFEEKLYYYLNL